MISPRSGALSILALISWPLSESDADTLDFTRPRVGLFVGGLAGLLALLLATDIIDAVGNDRALSPILAHAGVVGLLAAIALFARRPRPALVLAISEMIATAAVGTFGAVVIYFGRPGQIYAGPAFAVALVLIARAALVPSSARRTLAVGAVTATPLVIAYVLRGDPADLQPDFAGVWLSLFVAASAVVSRVIYGLQRRLREARRLGQYLLEAELGAGGMGVVYRAQHALLRRPTAVKVLEPGAEGSFPARFEREVRMTSRLTHPNTVTVFDYGKTPDGRFYYAMELLEGADLAEVVEVDGAQPAARAVHVVAAIAGALTEAHDIGLIHRDLKPSNIMLCRQGGVLDTPKLLDFGLVRDLGAADDRSSADAVIGTPMYLSPEAITDPENVDARSDLYALGAVGYFLLTGGHVFTGKTAVDVCRQHLDAIPEPPSTRLGAPVDEVLEALLLACLAKKPGDRPQSAAELAERLRACDVAPWSPDDALRWWTTHRRAIDRLRAGEGAGESRAMRIDTASR